MSIAQPEAARVTRTTPVWAAGDEGFVRFVQARRSALLRHAHLITGNRRDAEDLLQTALGNTYAAWDRIQDKGAIDAYVRRTMINAFASICRKRRVDEYPVDWLPEVAACHDPFAERDLRDALRAAVDNLTGRQRSIVILRFFRDLSEAETAAILGVSVGTVKSTTNRALTRLRGDARVREAGAVASPLPLAG